MAVPYLISRSTESFSCFLFSPKILTCTFYPRQSFPTGALFCLLVIIHDIEHLFTGLFVIHVYFLVKRPLKYFAEVLI